jgi:hypothetical protein
MAKQAVQQRERRSVIKSHGKTGKKHISKIGTAELRPRPLLVLEEVNLPRPDAGYLRHRDCMMFPRRGSTQPTPMLHLLYALPVGDHPIEPEAAA